MSHTADEHSLIADWWENNQHVDIRHSDNLYQIFDGPEKIAEGVTHKEAILQACQSSL